MRSGLLRIKVILTPQQHSSFTTHYTTDMSVEDTYILLQLIINGIDVTAAHEAGTLEAQFLKSLAAPSATTVIPAPTESPDLRSLSINSSRRGTIPVSAAKNAFPATASHCLNGISMGPSWDI